MIPFIILDRDGILNKLLIREDGSTDSPMTEEEIIVFSWVPKTLKLLNDLGYNLAVATNQPAAAKGKISYENLNKIHNIIINKSQSLGAKILSSHICFHRSQDNCNCRKPKTGLLQDIFNKYNIDKSKSWMVGDRATDIIAGNICGLKTALLGPSVFSDIYMLASQNIIPYYCGSNLESFIQKLE